MKNDAGAISCARYAFAPNYYHYCGPDTSGNFGAYVAESVADNTLVEYLSKFETLYPYLKSIAEANHIADALDPRVVEAYWVGNYLLNKVDPQHTHAALTDGQQLHRRLDNKAMQWLLPKIDKQAKLHHSFHVFNIFTRTGHRTVAHTAETMDQCRIGWGKIRDRDKSYELRDKNLFQIDSQKLTYINGKLVFEPEVREIVNPIEGLHLEIGEWVSFHWGFVCEKITSNQVKQLSRLTQYHLDLANETL